MADETQEFAPVIQALDSLRSLMYREKRALSIPSHMSLVPFHLSIFRNHSQHPEDLSKLRRHFCHQHGHGFSRQVPSFPAAAGTDRPSARRDPPSHATGGASRRGLADSLSRLRTGCRPLRIHEACNAQDPWRAKAHSGTSAVRSARSGPVGADCIVRSGWR